MEKISYLDSVLVNLEIINAHAQLFLVVRRKRTRLEDALDFLALGDLSVLGLRVPFTFLKF